MSPAADAPPRMKAMVGALGIPELGPLIRRWILKVNIEKSQKQSAVSISWCVLPCVLRVV